MAYLFLVRSMRIENLNRHGLAFVIVSLLIVACATDPREELLTQRIEEQALIGTRAFQQGNLEIVADQTYPRLVAQLGGRQKMIVAMRAAMKEMRAKGFEFAGFDFDDPTRPVPSNGELFSVVPETITMATRDATYTQKSFMLAISQNDGVTWTFIDGATLTPAILSDLFPNVPPSVRLPKPSPPVITRRK